MLLEDKFVFGRVLDHNSKGSQVIENFADILQDLGRGLLGVTTIPDEALITINSLEILGIIYLAIALSKLRERLAKMEGREEQRDREGMNKER
jgi:hypothetical protein